MILESHVDTRTAEFDENRRHFERLEAELAQHRAAARAGGGPDATARIREQGKLLVRERLERLLDERAPKNQ